MPTPNTISYGNVLISSKENGAINKSKHDKSKLSIYIWRVQTIYICTYIYMTKHHIYMTKLFSKGWTYIYINMDQGQVTPLHVSVSSPGVFTVAFILLVILILFLTVL